MKRRNWRTLALATALVLTLGSALSGCGSKPAAPSTPPASTPASTPAADASTPAANPSTPSGEQVLRVFIDGDNGNSLDPARWGDQGCEFGANVFEALVRVGDDLNFEPCLAESWETSEDGLTWTFHLRKGVQFHYDYGEMKASDVVYSIERLDDPAVGGAILATNMKKDNVASISATDDYTVEFKLKVADPLFLSRIGHEKIYVLSQKAIEELGPDGFSKKPVSTGPFYYVSGFAGQTITIAAHETYWGGRPKVDKVEYLAIPEPATLFNAFEAGEVDFFQISDSNKMLEYKPQTDKYTMQVGPSRNQNYVGVSYTLEPFNDIRVRQAVALSINYDDLCENYFMGLETPCDSLLAPACKYVEAGTYKPEYNPEKAKQLLAEAGYPNGFKTQIYAVNDQLGVGPATLIQAYLAQSGIQGELFLLDMGVFGDKMKAGECPIWVMYQSAKIEPDAFYLKWKTNTEATNSNFIRYSNADYDKAVDNAVNAKTMEDREKYFKEASKIMLADYVMIPVNSYSKNQIMHNYVKDYKIRKDWSSLFKDTYLEK